MVVPYKKLTNKNDEKLKGLKCPLVLKKARKQGMRFLTQVKTKDR